jgi:hypothetical protein
MNGIETRDREMIHDLLCRFFLAFDTRDWALMAATLSPDVFVDYASSGREEPTAMSAADFVARRRSAVDALSKHHSFSNLLSTREEGKVTARCNYTILRFATEPPLEGEDFYHSCGSYEFEFDNPDRSWAIASIKQRQLKSWGNRSLHGGSRPATP